MQKKLLPSAGIFPTHNNYSQCWKIFYTDEVPEIFLHIITIAGIAKFLYIARAGKQNKYSQVLENLFPTAIDKCWNKIAKFQKCSYTLISAYAWHATPILRVVTKNRLWLERHCDV